MCGRWLIADSGTPSNVEGAPAIIVTMMVAWIAVDEAISGPGDESIPNSINSSNAFST
jgi:hypothetical protein